MSSRYGIIMFALAAILLAVHAQGAQQQPQPPARAGTEDGVAIFQTRCFACHGNPNTPQKPDPFAIRLFTPEAIYASLATKMPKAHEQLGLTDDQKRVTAEFMGGRTIGSSPAGDAKNMPNRCSSNPSLTDPSVGSAWNGWGADSSNTRYQPNAGLTADQIPRLKLKWAFGYPTGVTAHGQPTVASGRVFVSTDIGYLYSLDAKTGCVYWSYETKTLARNSVSVGPIKGHGTTKYAVYVGDAKAYVHAVDAQSGAPLWKTRVEEHWIARITGSPKLYDGRLYVSVSSSEEFRGGTLDYPCCSSRGSVVALDANTGKQIWKTYVIPETPKQRGKNSKGIPLFAPAGGSVWNSPTVDPVRKAVYVGTGDAETEPAANTSDAIMALDMNTGKILWVQQAEVGDAFMGGCNPKTENCPEKQGPDLDIGNSPILKTMARGKRLLLAGTKDGYVLAVDPDREGTVVWKKKISENRGRLDGIVWGGAADDQKGYYGFNAGGMAAIQLATGDRAWFNPIVTGGARVSHAAAPSVVPGVVFLGGSDGKLHALAILDGHQLWEFDTDQEFTTVNKVPAKGGSISAAGPVVAGGMVFVGSGYYVTSSSKPGNVLLAFGVE